MPFYRHLRKLESRRILKYNPHLLGEQKHTGVMGKKSPLVSDKCLSSYQGSPLASGKKI